MDTPQTTPVSETEKHLVTRIEAQRRSTIIQWLAVIGAIACIALAAQLQEPINRQRRDLQLVLHSDIYKELPPKYAWVSAAGATFRGLAADILWIRAEHLKQEGKYYEAHQLARWICTLQPRFATVWSFQAWNMSYNISVAMHTGRERWQWVYNGIRLLRDEGIPNNPRVIPLYHQLAWTWFHKVGDRADDFHWFFKRTWASTMETLLGKPPVGLSNAATIDWFRPVAEAPGSLAELIAGHPGVEALVDELGDLGIDVTAGTAVNRVHHPLEIAFFRRYTRYLQAQQLASLRSAAQESRTEQQEEQRDRRFDDFAAFVESATATEAGRSDFDALLAWLRAKILREQYKMDPQIMLDLTGELRTREPIPIDWRTPWSQAMYWAKYGVDQGDAIQNVKEFDLINTDRIFLFSLALLAKEGRYTFRNNLDNPGKSFLAMSPDLRYIEAMHNMYLEVGPQYAEEGEEVGQTAGEMLGSGHVNNLHAAIVALFMAGHREAAEQYFDYLTINYKDPYTGRTKDIYLKGLDDFVLGELSEMASTYNEALYTIHAMLTNGYIKLAGGYADEFAAVVRNASLIYKKYQEEHHATREGRLTLPAFADLRGQALATFVVNRAYPIELRSLAWNREQPDIQRRYYDFVAGDLARQCEQASLDIAKAFPEPPGMDEWRKAHPAPLLPEEVSERQKEQAKARREAEP